MHCPSIMHIADMHLGSNISNFSTEKNILRCRELEHTCITVLEKAVDYNIVLFPGDVFDSPDVSKKTADMFLDAVSSAPNTHFFYSCGNHDSYISSVIDYCVKNRPDNLHIFGPEFVECVTIEELGTRVYGISFAQNSHPRSLLSFAPRCEPGYINIMCVHGDTMDSTSPYNPISLSSLEALGFDYVALGHVHNFSGIERIGNMHYSYSGVVEPRRFDETGKKGYICGTLQKGMCDLNFAPASKREYHIIDVDISNCVNYPSLISKVCSEIKSSKDIYRINLCGINRIFSSVNTDILEDAADAFYVKVTDSTRVEFDFSEYANDHTLKGHCARETLSLIENGTSQNEELYKKACSLLFDLLDGRGDGNDY